MDGKDKKG